MKQTFIITPDKNKIAVYESSGSGQPVLFIHGNSLGAELYSKQLNSELGKKYRLIAFDFSGHGDSDAALNPADAYSPQGLIETILEVINQLKLKDFIIAGHSLGGHLIMEAAESFPSVKGFVIFGAPPLLMPPDPAKVFLPNQALALGFKDELNDEEARLLADAFILPKSPSDETIFSLIKKSDKNFRSAFAASAFGGGLKDETEIAGKLKIPLAIIHGEKDQIVNLDYIKSLTIPALWRKEVQVITNAGHCPQWENAESFNNLIEKFIEECKQ